MPELDLPVQGYGNIPTQDDASPLPVAKPSIKVYITGNTEKKDNPIGDPMGNTINTEPAAYEEGSNPHLTFLNNLFGANGKERYQLWPERVVREGLSAAHDVMSGAVPQYQVDPETGDVHTSPQMIEKAQAISALAGTGGLAGADATLGATPFLRPALKYKGRLYKGKEGQQHMDVIPKELYPEFQQMAMSGEDISHYNFGFVNDRGHFLDREAALKYGIDSGLIDPQAGKFGALTSTLMADSSKPGVAIEAMAKTGKITNLKGEKIDAPRTFYRGTNAGDERRITTGVDAWDKYTFAADNLDAAKMYGKDIATYEAKPDAKILYEGTKEFNKIAGKIKKDENLLQYSHRAAEAAKAAGYDAAWFKRQGDVGTAIFNPDKFILKADSSKEGSALQASKPFFSAVEHQVNNINQSKMTGAQWLGTLSNKPGVKPEEMQWTGLQDFLTENAGNPVTKQQIQEHLANNKIELKEVSKGGEQPTQYTVSSAGGPASSYREPARFNSLEEANSELAARQAASPNSYHNIAELPAEGTNTKYHRDDLVLPGGENYREMLLTLPERQPKAFVERDKFVQELKNKYGDQSWDLNMSPAESQKFKQLQDEYFKAKNAEDYNPAKPYKSSHWDEPNILAHVRMNDRTIDGKKSLHLEEIQSDWHQQGREKGYKQDIEKLPIIQEIRALGIKYPWERISPKQIEEAGGTKELADRWSREMPSASGVPDAPFKKSWHELALKRMIREAAEKGYDRLSWTPGEAQAARYDLSKQVDEVRLVPKSKNTDPNFEYRIDAFKNGERVVTKPANNEKDVADIVGKEVAKKLFEENKDNKGSALKGQQLSIGGEGMKGFYDQIIPKALEKIGKEHRVKVKQGEIESPYYGQKHPIHYIDIPQSLKDQALHKGFPLFAKGVSLPLMPVDHDPFKENKNAIEKR